MKRRESWRACGATCRLSWTRSSSTAIERSSSRYVLLDSLRGNPWPRLLQRVVEASSCIAQGRAPVSEDVLLVNLAGETESELGRRNRVCLISTPVCQEGCPRNALNLTVVSCSTLVAQIRHRSAIGAIGEAGSGQLHVACEAVCSSEISEARLSCEHKTYMESEHVWV